MYQGVIRCIRCHEMYQVPWDVSGVMRCIKCHDMYQVSWDVSTVFILSWRKGRGTVRSLTCNQLSWYCFKLKRAYYLIFYIAFKCSHEQRAFLYVLKLIEKFHFLFLPCKILHTGTWNDKLSKRSPVSFSQRNQFQSCRWNSHTLPTFYLTALERYVTSSFVDHSFQSHLEYSIIFQLFYWSYLQFPLLSMYTNASTSWT